MKKNTLRLTLIIILVLLLIGAAGYYFYQRFNAPKAAPQGFAMPVVGMVVEAGNIDEKVSAVGTLEANKIATIKSEITGKVVKIDFAEGREIKKGGLLAKIDDSNYASDRDRTKADLELAQASRKRAVELFKSGAVSREAVDQAQATFKQAKANYDLAKSRLEKTQIKAPFNGVVSFRNVNIGDLVAEGTEITKIVDISVMKAEFSVAEKYLSRIRVNQPVYITVDSYPNVEFIGKIYAIDPVTDLDTRTIRAKAMVENKAEKLQAGMSAYLNIELSHREGVILVPEEAIVSGNKKTSVFKIINGAAKESVVEIGDRQDGMAEIISGVESGDTIITAGHMKVKDGMPVNAQNLSNPAPDQSVKSPSSDQSPKKPAKQSSEESQN